MANLKTIVKIQRPLVTNASPALILIYNAGRDKQTEQMITPEIAKAMGDESKMFFHAVWRPALLEWEVGEPAKWQEW